MLFWGALKKYTWMGYDFKRIESPIEGKTLDVFKIVGLRDEKDRITESTSLVGTVVVQYGLYDDKHFKTCPHRILCEEDIEKLLEL